MPKFPTIPRLTIVVPYCGDTHAFESSLVSVLQHRPDACEVIVPHGGDYDDPFDLGDEVNFIDAGTTSFTAQVAEAASIARGRFVHVLAEGNCATQGWSEPAMEFFEHHDTGLVIPVVRHSDRDEIVYAGWRRSASSACELIAAGSPTLHTQDTVRVEGGFLHASFWRRDLLRSLSGIIRSDDSVEASMAYSLAARQAGWRCLVSRKSTLHSADTSHGQTDLSSRINTNHRRLQAIADRFSKSGGGWGKSAGRFVSTYFSGGIVSAVRRATAPLAQSEIESSLRCNTVLRCDDHVESVRIPVNANVPLRRAA